MNVRLYKNRRFLRAQKLLSLFLVFTFVFTDLGILINLSPVPEAYGADVSIDTSAETDGRSHIQAGSQIVFTEDQTGYKFYRDSSGICVYSKTTNGGDSWGTPVTVDSQTDCIAVEVWYDRWTPGDSGGYIHILTMDTTTDDLYYNRLDTLTSDTLLKGATPVDASVNSNNSKASFTFGANYGSITKGTDGTIYLMVSDFTDSYVVECSSGCDLTTDWTETGSDPMDKANDYHMLAPLPGGDILLINRDLSADDMRSKVWNNTSWDASWTTFETAAPDNTTYDVGMALAVSTTTSDIYFAYIADNSTLGTDDDIRTAIYSGGTWTNETDVVTNSSRGITNVAISVDNSNDDVYVAYSGRTTAGTASTGNIYWHKSFDKMTSWETENGPVNTSANDIYGVSLNTSNSQRIYATWFGVTGATVYGSTIDDIFPGIHVSAIGSQIASTTAGTTGEYLGGAFAITNNFDLEAYDVTAVTITASGTIDGSTNIENIKLFYETDTTTPYDCVDETYAGTESQFGATDANGFSGPNGVSSFTGTTINVSTTTALCLYPVMDFLDNTISSSTFDVLIEDPSTDVTVTSSTAGPDTPQEINNYTIILNDTPTLTHYHWRADNGTEVTASSTTSGIEDVPFPTMKQSVPARLRLQVSNEGGSSTPAMQYRLEYTSNPGVCTDATGWIDVDAVADDFDMYDSANLTDSNDTTNIAVANGGVTDENTTFLTPNGGVKDTSSQTGNIILGASEFVELEYSIVASTTATEGNSYCFRVTDNGTPLFTYDVFPAASVNADVAVTISTTTSQVATTSIPSTNFYVGSLFVLTENNSSRDVTSITISETGTVDAQNGLENVKLYYELDTTEPYNCNSESYAGGESQFGTTDVDGFSGANGTSTFTDTVSISTTSSMCLYTVLDTTDSAQDGETINIVIDNSSVDVMVTGGGSVGPSVVRDLNASTTLEGSILTQTRYHWKNDNGTEATSTSMTSGSENTTVDYIAQSTPVRLRLEVSNEGPGLSPDTALRLEVGTKITTCSSVISWADVGEVGGAWDMFDSSSLTEGADTTNIGGANGGVTDDNTTFKSTNAAIKDTSSQIATTTFTSSEFLEAEFSIKQTASAGFDTTYCFRLSNAGDSLNTYSVYPELTTSPKRDFEIQRGTVNMTGSTVTITAGTDYVAPMATSSAFIRITNSHHTGAGENSGGGNQTSDDVTVYISNPENLLTSVTFTRAGAFNNTEISWEIIEFIGAVGSDNEMIVRDQTVLTYTSTSLTATGTTVTGVVDDTDVVVFITGQYNPDTGRTSYNVGQSVSEWNATSSVPVFTRGEDLSTASRLSYAVVEFTGPNWVTQRVEHTYTAAGATETENITAVNSLARTFIHTQKMSGTGLSGLDEFGHEIWMSSIGVVSFFLQSSASTPSGQTSVVWIMENTQTTTGSMVVTRSNGLTNGGAEPLTLSVSVGTTLEDLSNASIFTNTSGEGTGTEYPRAIAGITIASSTHYEIWRSDTGSALNYRTEVVEWPTAGLAFRQNDYRFYVDNDALDPTDPWPVGVSDLGENTVITASDEPLGEGEHVRIRMSLTVLNSTFPEFSKSFKLQYAERITTCSAIGEGSWFDVGQTGSSTIWKAYDAPGVSDGTSLSVYPPTPGDLNLTFSDTAGSYEENNNSAVNPFTVLMGDDIEYDWHIEQNGATAKTFYCFRMVESDGAVLAYNDYPQLRTGSYTVRTQNWQWFDDEENETPTTTLAAENVAPIEIGSGDIIKLRVTVKETKNVSEDDARFKLQYSQHSDFAIVDDVIATSTCVATSTWCYADGAGVDNAIVSSSTLSDTDSCIAGVGDGCGTHNESPDTLTGYVHENNAASEYEFTITINEMRTNAVYYFRLYDVVENIPIEKNVGESYPSLVTEGAALTLTVQGLPSGTTTAGIVTDATTTATSINFSPLPVGVIHEAAHRISVNTNALEGYQVLKFSTQQLINSYGTIIEPVTSTNSSPAGWSTGCDVGAIGCFGYHTTDAVLQGGSTRFSATDTYAQLSTSTEEIMFSPMPTNDTHDIVYKIRVNEKQPGGLYESEIIYLAIPTF